MNTKFITEVEAISSCLIDASDNLTDAITILASEDYKVSICYIEYYQAINKLISDINKLQSDFDLEFKD